MKGFHVDDEGYIYWNGKRISDTPQKRPKLKPKAGDVVKDAKSGKAIGKAIGKVIEFTNEPVGGPIITLPKGSDGQVLVATGADRVIWDNPEKEIDDIRKDISDLKDRVGIIQEDIRRLDTTKIDKPSISQELKDAEAYMDDYLAIAKDTRRKAFARRQRIKNKLGRIKKANKTKDVAHVRSGFIIAFVATILLTLGMVFIGGIL